MNRRSRRHAPVAIALGAWLSASTALAHPATPSRRSAHAVPEPPAVPSSPPSRPPPRAARREPAAPCLRAAVEVRRLRAESAVWRGPLTDCEGRPTLQALAALSWMAGPGVAGAVPDLTPDVRALRRTAPAAGWTLIDARPPRRATRASARTEDARCPAGQEPEPSRASSPTPARASASASAPASGPAARRARRTRAPRVVCRAIALPSDPHTHDPVVALERGTRALHPRLLAMLAQIVEHFPGHAVEVVSGFRPSRNPQAGSRHAHARALDFRLAGVGRAELRDFARTLPNAGVGYYPNSVFVHLDVRDPDEGPARWTDYAGPGERARYGHWPPTDGDVVREADFLVRQASAALEAARRLETEGEGPGG